MNSDKEGLKRTFQEASRAYEEAKNAMEEEERVQRDKNRKKEKACFRETLFASMKSVFSGDQFSPVRDAGVHLGFAAKARPVSISEITFIFSKGDASMRIKYFFYDEEDGADSNLSIEVKTESETFYLEHLSAFEDEKWRAAAQGFGMPDCLHASARITEFCMALMAHFVTKNELERYVDSLDVIERDGAKFYAGHGGYMPVMFNYVFREENGFYLGVSY